MYKYLFALLISFGYFNATAQDKTIKEKIEGNLTYQYKYDSIWEKKYILTFESSSKYFNGEVSLSKDCSLTPGYGRLLKRSIICVVKKYFVNHRDDHNTYITILILPTSDGIIKECWIKWNDDKPLLNVKEIENLIKEVKSLTVSFEEVPKGKPCYCHVVGFGISLSDLF